MELRSATCLVDKNGIAHSLMDVSGPDRFINRVIPVARHATVTVCLQQCIEP